MCAFNTLVYIWFIACVHGFNTLVYGACKINTACVPLIGGDMVHVIILMFKCVCVCKICFHCVLHDIVISMLLCQHTVMIIIIPHW